MSIRSAAKHEEPPPPEPEILMTKDIELSNSWDRAEWERDTRQGFDLATTLERIEKNFVITDPRLPDNPIVRHPVTFKAFFLLFVSTLSNTILNVGVCFEYTSKGMGHLVCYLKPSCFHARVLYSKAFFTSTHKLLNEGKRRSL